MMRYALFHKFHILYGGPSARKTRGSLNEMSPRFGSSAARGYEGEGEQAEWVVHIGLSQ